MVPTHVVPNGVDALTGGYSHPPVSVAEIALAARELGLRAPVATRGGTRRPLDFAETGWGIVFPESASEDVRRALDPLVRHRQEQTRGRFRELVYHLGDTKETFLCRNSLGPGPADPEALPYYLLLAGGPQEIPFSFQYQLDVQYAVGRLACATPAEYAAYARNVVELERRRPSRPRKAALFATQHPDDEITRTCLDHLARPLAGRLRNRLQGCELQTFFRDEATKERLGRLLGGAETPDLLFTAGHGLSYTSGDPGQLQNQGALLCQGWPGPIQWRGKPVERDWFLSGDDLDQDEACVPGLFCFHLACFSAGTPRQGTASRFPGSLLTQAAPQDFLAALPLRLLSRGAAAVIGHVDTVWEDSLLWQGAGSQVPVFEKVLTELLLDGFPVGESMKYFGERYAEIAADLMSHLEQERWGERCEDEAIASLWLASLDARSYVVLGDPAVHLPV
jgi:hypothetical protein